ncbi:hypothetical protein BPAE_0095g00190 [Botrytis paeoniae]|uniref:Uncharacterized protein n=1 Tax=Botrytis paeoniae TaxID=278948 RepID=A0A4Z1FQJ0_9HELO|nr:hypothetical protein BPAE_0095g00190 [Botrytis paeoniae]
MLIVVSASLCIHTIPVLGPSKPSSSETLIDIFKFGRANGAVLVPAIIDTLCRDPSGLAVLKSLEEKTPPLDFNRQVSPIDSHSLPDTSSGQSPHIYISSTSMRKFDNSGHPHDPRSSRKSEKLCKSKAATYMPQGSYSEIIAAKIPDRTPTPSAEAPPTVPIDNGRRMNPKQHQ